VFFFFFSLQVFFAFCLQAIFRKTSAGLSQKTSAGIKTKLSAGFSQKNLCMTKESPITPPSSSITNTLTISTECSGDA
jgi:hypothetical protein